jgi:hypothetical protein
VYVCVLCLNYFRLSNCKTKGEIYKIGGVSMSKHCQMDMICHHQKGGDCEEDFLLRLGWVLMITNSHHKRIKTIWRLKLKNEDNGT